MLAAKSVSDQEKFKAFICRVRAGDEKAAEELVEMYEPLVRRELRIKMTDRRMARLFETVDVCQSIWSSFFVRVAAGQYDLESPQQLAKLLLAIAKNKLASQARKNHAQKRDVSRLSSTQQELTRLPDEQESPSASVTMGELFAKIQGCLS